MGSGIAGGVSVREGEVLQGEVDEWEEEMKVGVVVIAVVVLAVDDAAAAGQ